MRRTIRAIVIFVASVLGLTMLGVAPASAEALPETKTSYSGVKVSESVSVTAVATSDVAGKVNLRFENPSGTAFKGKCPKVKKLTKKLLKQKSCFRLKKGVKFTNSGRDRAGKLVKYQDKTRSRTKFVKAGKSWKKGWRKATCANKVLFKKKKRPKLKASRVHLVSQFDTAVTVRVDEAVSITAHADAKCEADGTTASGSASFTATGSASAYATASANTKDEAIVRAVGSVRGRLQEEARIQAEVAASAKAEGEASAEAKCTSTPPVTPPPPPPVTPPPSLIEVDTINDVVVNNTRTIQVSGNVPSGHTATLFASAKNGGTITENKTQEVSGSFSVKVTYLAPDEVPASGTDWVVFTLTQDDSQADDVETNKFVITPRPVDPL